MESLLSDFEKLKIKVITTSTIHNELDQDLDYIAIEYTKNGFEKGISLPPNSKMIYFFDITDTYLINRLISNNEFGYNLLIQKLENYMELSKYDKINLHILICNYIQQIYNQIYKQYKIKVFI